jgi:hypothetical protein
MMERPTSLVGNLVNKQVSRILAQRHKLLPSEGQTCRGNSFNKTYTKLVIDVNDL